MYRVGRMTLKIDWGYREVQKDNLCIGWLVGWTLLYVSTGTA